MVRHPSKQPHRGPRSHRALVEPPAEPKAPPARGGPHGGLPLGGGALPDGSLPYLVEPPGPDATGPDLPVIGDGKPDVPEAKR